MAILSKKCQKREELEKKEKKKKKKKKKTKKKKKKQKKKDEKWEFSHIGGFKPSVSCVSVSVVNLKHDIAFLVQTIRSLAQNNLFTLKNSFCIDLKNQVLTGTQKIGSLLIHSKVHGCGNC